jgi:hypothetical protein
MRGTKTGDAKRFSIGKTMYTKAQLHNMSPEQKKAVGEKVKAMGSASVKAFKEFYGSQ